MDALTFWWKRARAAEAERDNWRKVYAALGPQIDSCAMDEKTRKALAAALKPGDGL